MLVDWLQWLLTTDVRMVGFLGTPAKRADSTNGVFPMLAPDQPAMPYVVYTQVSGEPLSVTYQGTAPLLMERWRISCYGTTYKNAKAFAKYVRSLLIDVTPNTTSVGGGIQVSGAYCVMEADEAESMGRGTLFCTHLDVQIIYTDVDA